MAGEIIAMFLLIVCYIERQRGFTFYNSNKSLILNWCGYCRCWLFSLFFGAFSFICGNPVGTKEDFQALAVSLRVQTVRTTKYRSENRLKEEKFPDGAFLFQYMENDNCPVCTIFR